MKVFLFAVAMAVLWCNLCNAAVTRRHGPFRMQATASSLQGRTEAGTRTHGGAVAADPAFLPLGTRIRVTGAGQFSGIYLVTDTGAKVVGRYIDIYVPNRTIAKQFGKKLVSVSVLKWGPGEVSRTADRAAAKTAPRAVKPAEDE